MTSGLNGSAVWPGAERNAWKHGSRLRQVPSGQFSVGSCVPVPGWFECGGTAYASDESARLLRFRSGWAVSSELEFVIAQRPIVSDEPVVLPASSAASELRKNSVPPLSLSYACPGTTAGQIVNPVGPRFSVASFVLANCPHGTDGWFAASLCFDSA